MSALSSAGINLVMVNNVAGLSTRTEGTEESSLRSREEVFG